MRLGLTLAAFLLAVTPRAQAQVTVNPGALDALPGRPAHPAPAPPRTAPHRPTPTSHTTRPNAPTVAAPARPKPPPTIPVAPPAIAAIPPPVPVPLAHPPPVPTVPEAADAPGGATPIPNGLRITFGPDRSDLNPASVAALRAFAEGLRDNELQSINVYAYAAGSSEDPSTPRRLSLSRALAARAVLINDGIASPRIYPRALGASGGDTDPDRVDVVAGPPGPPAATPASSPATAPR